MTLLRSLWLWFWLAEVTSLRRHALATVVWGAARGERWERGPPRPLRRYPAAASRPPQRSTALASRRSAGRPAR